MRIQVSRTGGFAGISRHHEVDTEGREDAAEWESLAEEVLAAATEAGTPDAPPAGVEVGPGAAVQVLPRVHDPPARLRGP
ncbi:protealysin inhibitor emfourin, partial [Streptomyces cyaneofuscatus]